MGYYFLFIGSLISAFALWATVKHLRLILLGVRARGVIVDVDEQMHYGDSQRKKIYFCPVIEFETSDGHPFQFTFPSGSTHKRPVIGNEVSVVYDVDHPEAATLNSFLGLWAGPFAGLVLGGGVLYGGIQMVFFGVR